MRRRSSGAGAGFVPVVVEAPEPASEAAPGRMKIVLGDDVRVIVDVTVHAPALARVVAVVGLGMVSHELRTPLVAIKGSAGAVLDAARPFAPAETREFFRIITEQANRMFALIADLLDAGMLTVSPEPTEVALLLDRARNTFLSGGGRHAVRIDLPLYLPRAMADRQRVE